MPHATGAHDTADDQDDYLISTFLNPADPTQQGSLNLDRDLELGEKADDAVDYEEISDNDLADDDDAENGSGSQHGQTKRRTDISDDLDDFMQGAELPALSNGNSLEDDGIDDLFGEEPLSPLDTNGDSGGIGARHGGSHDLFGAVNESTPLADQSDPRTDAEPQRSDTAAVQPSFSSLDFQENDAPPSKEQQLQQQLFAMSRVGQDTLPAPPENQEELLSSLWPKFKHDTIPKFIDLLPPKKARYVGKTIPKPPRSVNPTKVNLELAQDQEKSFRTWPTSNKRSHDYAEQLGVIIIEQDHVDNSIQQESLDLDSDYENDRIAGMSWQDLQIVCGDWDTHSLAESQTSDQMDSRDLRSGYNGVFGDRNTAREDEFAMPPSKRRKTTKSEIMSTPQFPFPSLQDPEFVTSKLARAVTLDLNDARLIIDHSNPSAPSRNVPGRSTIRRSGRGAFAKGLSQRYNISNDDAYDLLKENHQSKVRSMLNNVAVDHSLPAVRLQWPFYKTKLDKQDARAFHRPSLKVLRHEQVSIGKPRFLKRKHLKGKDTQSLFHDSKDLSLGDNSNVLLLEYSEEYPTMMSNIGMGNRVINYYRRKTMEDTLRPKLDVGETVVLLPQDKSPFSIFGHVDPGQTTPALYNGLYRAPIFKQEAKNTDFLVIKTTTGFEGSTWYLRNIENIYCVGQEFPSVDVPGPHSRKVTTASKNRLKMISYRLIRKNKSHRINVGEVTSHFIDTTDMQNRQKMKEFMSFNKEHKEWQMRSGESVPDEETVRSMVKPEDVCLLESMQVGQQHLHDAGFNKEDDESEGEDDKEGQSIEQQLAPWFTSRNFLHATQGKAMLALHGEGDPTGRGEAFSFIKTSMKGGFKAAEASATEKMRAKQMKDSNGHAYNVQEQQRSYEQSIRRTWEAQKQSLSSTHEPTDLDMDEDPVEEASNNALRADTPRSEAQTPGTARRRDDETGSQFTTHSTSSQSGRIIRVTRNIRDESGVVKPVVEFVRDAKVIRQYLRRRHQKEEETLGISDMVPTDDPEQNRRRQIWLRKEHDRLQKNKERRIARDKAKGVHFDGAGDEGGSPTSSVAVPAKAAGTQRKCATCGQVGHIKTNKKLCPMLNGTMKPDEGFNGSAFTMGASAP